jgi:glycosyltransferase involved in cell wall biosynthesis
MVETAIDVAILMPVFNDWHAAETVISLLETVLANRRWRVAIVCVDDGSSPQMRAGGFAHRSHHFQEVIVVNLRRNLGHQRAIAIGLAWIYENVRCRSVLIMDADGQDRPEDVPRLLDKFEQLDASSVVFAGRLRRGEGLVFSIFYRLYRGLHWLLTGISVRVGNFSVLSFDHLATLVAVSDLWNHYAAAVFKSRLPHELLPTSRGDRISGKSKMNFVALVTHGLSAISVFGETVGVRLLIGSAVASLVLLLVLALVFFIRLTTTLAIPGWATYTGGLLVVALLGVINVAIVVTLIVLSSRNNMSFLPLRDYSWFIKSIERSGGK